MSDAEAPPEKNAPGCWGDDEVGKGDKMVVVEVVRGAGSASREAIWWQPRSRNYLDSMGQRRKGRGRYSNGWQGDGQLAPLRGWLHFAKVDLLLAIKQKSD